MGPSNSSCWSFMSAERRETWQTRTPVVSQLGVGGGGRTIDAIIVCVVVRFSHSTRVPLSQVWIEEEKFETRSGNSLSGHRPSDGMERHGRRIDGKGRVIGHDRCRDGRVCIDIDAITIASIATDRTTPPERGPPGSLNLGKRMGWQR